MLTTSEIRRRPLGSIDTDHYDRRARDLRAAAWRDALRNTCVLFGRWVSRRSRSTVSSVPFSEPAK